MTGIQDQKVKQTPPVWVDQTPSVDAWVRFFLFSFFFFSVFLSLSNAGNNERSTIYFTIQAQTFESIKRNERWVSETISRNV